MGGGKLSRVVYLPVCRRVSRQTVVIITGGAFSGLVFGITVGAGGIADTVDHISAFFFYFRLRR